MDAAESTAAIEAAAEPSNVDLDDRELAALMAFLESLTDPESLRGKLGIPSQVPSGLPLDTRQQR